MHVNNSRFIAQSTHGLTWTKLHHILFNDMYFDDPSKKSLETGSFQNIKTCLTSAALVDIYLH